MEKYSELWQSQAEDTHGLAWQYLGLSEFLHHQCCHLLSRKPSLFIVPGTQLMGDMHCNDYRRERKEGGALLSFLKFKRPLPLRVTLVLQSHRKALLPNTENKTGISRGLSTASGQGGSTGTPRVCPIFKDTWWGCVVVKPAANTTG